MGPQNAKPFVQNSKPRDCHWFNTCHVPGAVLSSLSMLAILTIILCQVEALLPLFKLVTLSLRRSAWLASGPVAAEAVSTQLHQNVKCVLRTIPLCRLPCPSQLSTRHRPPGAWQLTQSFSLIGRLNTYWNCTFYSKRDLDAIIR